MVINGKGPIRPESEKRADAEKNEDLTEIESRKDQIKNKKRKKKENRDKQDTGSSSPESSFSMKNKEVDEEIANMHLRRREKRKKDRRLRVGSDAVCFEADVLEEVAGSIKKRAGNDEESELEKNFIHTGSKERVDNATKEQKIENRKDSEVLKSPLAEASTQGSFSESTVLVKNVESNGHKRKTREWEDTFIRAEKDESNTREKFNKALSTKDKETAKDGSGVIPSTSAASDKKRKRMKEKKDDAADGLESSPEGTSKNGMVAGKIFTEETNRAAKDSKTSHSKKKSKEPRRVSFSGNVEVFPLTDDTSGEEHAQKDLVRGKRFSLEEDRLVKEAVLKYIQVNQLGEEGLDMVLNCRSHPQARNCWKQIGASLPWRPCLAVYSRAHVLFQRSERRKWEPEEYEALRRLYEQYGPDWKKLGESLGKHRLQVKDTWRRIGLLNRRSGHWSQEEYQALFDLVNVNLKMKASKEKKTKYGMLRDNISWGAISQKLSTRFSASCCMKWYNQLTSPLVSEGLWADSDDYQMLDALQKVDACCVEDVDWDNLLDNRSGEICRKRWGQMSRHIGEHREKSFIEQVDVLSKRYSPEVVEYRE